VLRSDVLLHHRMGERLRERGRKSNAPAGWATSKQTQMSHGPQQALYANNATSRFMTLTAVLDQLHDGGVVIAIVLPNAPSCYSLVVE
jgi:hypothetical protein